VNSVSPHVNSIVRRKNGELFFHPVGETRIEEGDLLIVVGKADSMQKLIETNK
jgi:K+/H+ antiporter YhaU regulatory subunit KhtT